LTHIPNLLFVYVICKVANNIIQELGMCVTFISYPVHLIIQCPSYRDKTGLNLSCLPADPCRNQISTEELCSYPIYQGNYHCSNNF